MRSTVTILIAAAVFLAFAGITPEDLGRPGDVAASPAAELSVPAAPTGAEAAPEADKPSSPANEVSEAVAAAISGLSRHVRRSSHPEALRYAFRAYFNYRSAHPEDVRKPYLYYVDFGLDNRTPRGYVFDMEKLALVEGPFTVAHGSGSATGGSAVPRRFLNTRGSNATSLGLYLAQETYSFSGKSGGRRYSSIGLRLRGLSGSFNSAARARGIVVHGAPYVTAQRAGRSQGCPAMEQELARELIPMIANGGLVFHFSPNDPSWMRADPWAGSAGASLALGE